MNIHFPEGIIVKGIIVKGIIVKGIIVKSSVIDGWIESQQGQACHYV